MIKPKLTFRDGVVVRRRDVVGNEVVTTDGAGKEIGRRALTQREIDLDAAKDMPTPDRALVTALEAASTIADVKAALIERHGG